jgi:hypothetical protein
MSNPIKNAMREAATPGADRDADNAPPASGAAPEAAEAPRQMDERPTRTEPPIRPPPTVPRPSEDSASATNPLSQTLTKLSLLERFEPEARDLNPPLVQVHFDAQAVYNQVFEYYNWRFTDIAYATESTIAYVAQIDASADRVAQVTVNAIVNKLIIANRTDGLAVANLNNPVGPPKGFLYPALAAAVIAATGKTSPLWSGDQFFIPDLNNAIPVLQDHTGNAIANIHQFPANPGQDNIVNRFCNAGKIPLRSTDWKIPGGTPHWLFVRADNNGRTTGYVMPDVHPDNFDPANSVLSAICASTAQAPAGTRYVIMKSVATTTLLSLISEAYEES